MTLRGVTLPLLFRFFFPPTGICVGDYSKLPLDLNNGLKLPTRYESPGWLLRNAARPGAHLFGLSTLSFRSYKLAL
jgi:hypothetical protein